MQPGWTGSVGPKGADFYFPSVPLGEEPVTHVSGIPVHLHLFGHGHWRQEGGRKRVLVAIRGFAVQSCVIYVDDNHKS